MSRKLIWVLACIMTITMVWLIYMQASWFKSALTVKQQEFTRAVNKSLFEVVEKLEEREVVLHLNNEVIAFSFDSVPDMMMPPPDINKPGHVIADSMLHDSTHGDRIMVMSRDSSFFVLTDSSDSEFPFDNQVLDKQSFQNEIQSRIKNKTVFVENLVNKLIRKKVNIEDRVSPRIINDLLCRRLRENGIASDYEFAIRKENGTFSFRSVNFQPQILDASYYEISLFPNDIISPVSTLVVFFPDENKISMASLSKSAITAVILTIIIMLTFAFTLIVIFRQKKLSEMKTDFINNMTHELKTPISSISLASQMLKDKSVPKEGAGFDHIVSVIEGESKRLGFQVERVLQMAVIERGRAKMKVKELYVNDLIKKVVNNFDLKIKERNGKISCFFNAKDDLIEGDEMHITNLVFNLLDNALKYTETEPNLTISTTNIKEGVQISIADNGIGISRDNQKRIFDQFFRVHTGNVHNVKGFGIGLSYVKSVVDEHHGTINLKSELGKGTTFFVYLPFEIKK